MRTLISRAKLPLLIGLAGFLFGLACTFTFLKLSPETSAGLLGLESRRHQSTKPIVPALNLTPQANDDEALAQAQAQAQLQQQQRGRGGPPLSAFFDKDDEEVLNGQDPFVAMRKMRQQMEQEMLQGFGGMGAGDEGITAGNEITAKEDAHSVSYEIKGADQATLSTSVRNGFLTVSGETKQERGGMLFQASFHRMLSLPPSVDASKMETFSEKDKVVLRFPKKTS